MTYLELEKRHREAIDEGSEITHSKISIAYAIEVLEEWRMELYNKGGMIQNSFIWHNIDRKQKELRKLLEDRPKSSI